MAAAINAVVIRPLDNSFFTVEKDKLQRIFKLQSARAACKLQQPGCARPSVAGAYKPQIVEDLRVVVPRDGDEGRPGTRTSCANIDHVTESTGSPGVKLIELGLQTCFFQLGNNVISRFY